jgi:hypothetical protein
MDSEYMEMARLHFGLKNLALWLPINLKGM